MEQNSHIVCPHCDAINRVPNARLGQGPKCGACHQPLFDGHPIELGESKLDRYLQKSDLPVLIDFWAPWCGPCRMMAPVYGQAAGRYAGKVVFAKLNTEDHPNAAARFSIRGIPTLILFQGGREVDRISGALAGPQLTAWIDQRVR